MNHWKHLQLLGQRMAAPTVHQQLSHWLTENTFDFKAVTVDGENALLRDGSLIVWHSESLVDDLMACNFQTAFEQLSFLWKKRGNTLSIS